MNFEEAINDQYGQSDLANKILSALKSKGVDPTNITQDKLALFEEVHIRGREATLELARDAELSENMKVLDVGSGIGGPARTLATEFNCHVTGLDLNQEYCRAAKVLTDLMGLSDKVAIKQGDALDLPFEDTSFDLVWTQHTLMNIEDKKQFFKQAYRVLRLKGCLALYEVYNGPVSPPHFPVVWANSPSISFLISPQELHRLILNRGFREISWKDDTKKCIEFMRSSRTSTAPKEFGHHIIIGPDAGKKSANITRNLEEGRIVVIQGIFEKSE